VLGDEGTVSALDRERIAEFHRHHYRPGNIVLAAAGDLDHDKVAAGIDRRFAGPSDGSPPERTPPEKPARRVAVVHRPTEQAHVMVGMPALDRDDDDRYALSVLNHVLGGGMSSRLFQDIREERGLAYSVYSYRTTYQGTGALAVYAGTAPGHAGLVIDLIDAALDRLLADGLTDRELAVAQSHLDGSLALSLEDSGARMSRLGRAQLVHGRVPSLEELTSRLAAVTLDDVDRVIERVLGRERVLAVIGPFEQSDFAGRDR
jgi:predicted Zn-dependent peptidase